MIDDFNAAQVGTLNLLLNIKSHTALNSNAGGDADKEIYRIFY